jgi:hypothetical protein
MGTSVRVSADANTDIGREQKQGRFIPRRCLYGLPFHFQIPPNRTNS